MINQQRAMNQFMELVQISSVSKNERAFAEYLMNHFRELGYEVTEDLQSKNAVPGASVGNVIVKVPGQGALSTQPAIALSAHMDTVRPGENIKPQLTPDGERIVSDGTTILGADDKGGVAQILELIQVLREDQIAHPPLELIFPICEEIRLLGSRFLNPALVTAKTVYVIDGGPNAGDVLVGAPTIYDCQGKIIGKAAHAGVEPDKGISSIQVLAQAITKMKLLKVDEETSSNIGFVQTDYPLNVVPEITTFGFEVRSLDDKKAEAQLQSMVDAVETAAKAAGASVEWDNNKVLTAYHLAADNPVLKHYHQVCEANGIEVHEIVTRGGTDLSSYMVHGLEGVVIATGGVGPHTLEEYLDVSIFMRSLELLFKLITTKMA